MIRRSQQKGVPWVWMARIQFWRSRKSGVPFHCHYFKIHSSQKWKYPLGSYFNEKWANCHKNPRQVEVPFKSIIKTKIMIVLFGSILYKKKVWNIESTALGGCQFLAYAIICCHWSEKMTVTSAVDSISTLS